MSNKDEDMEDEEEEEGWTMLTATTTTSSYENGEHGGVWNYPTEDICASMKQSKYVGCYDAADTIIFYATKKPHWFRRFCSRVFLGWKWVDFNE